MGKLLGFTLPGAAGATRLGGRGRVARRPRGVCFMTGTGEKGNPYRITVLAGDGRGPEMAEIGVRVLNAIGEYTDLHFNIDYAEYGEDCRTKTGALVPAETIQKCKGSDAVLKSYQGTAKDTPLEDNAHLLLRRDLELYAQVIPTTVYPELADLSVFKSEKISGLDLLLVREISGGVLRDRESGLPELESEEKSESFMRYEKEQVERFARLVLKLAEQRSGKITSVDRADQLKVSQFWREIIHRTIDAELDDRVDITVNDFFVDDFCRAAVIDPTVFDVVCTSNLFGDVIAELLQSVAGPARITPSSWFGTSGLSIHGPADMYNASAYLESKEVDFSRGPVAMIRSVSMLLRYGLDEPIASDLVQKALMKTFEDCVTERLASYMTAEQRGARPVVSAKEFCDNVITSLQYMRQFEMVCDPVECGE